MITKINICKNCAQDELHPRFTEMGGVTLQVCNQCKDIKPCISVFPWEANYKPKIRRGFKPKNLLGGRYIDGFFPRQVA